MARLPTISQNVRLATASLSGPLLNVDTSSGLTAVASETARLRDQYATLQEQWREDEARTWAARTAAETRRDWTVELNRRQGEAGEGAPGFTEAFMADYGSDIQERLSTAPSSRARAIATERLSTVGDDLWGNSFGFEANAQYSRHLADFNVALQGHLNAIAAGADPAIVAAEYRQDLADAEGWMRPDDLSAHRVDGAAMMGEALVDGMIARGDLAGARREIEIPPGRPLPVPPGAPVASGEYSLPDDVPEAWGRTHAAHAIHLGINPDVTFAIARSESGFANIDTQIRHPDGSAVSDATGPFQMISTTFEGVARAHPELGLTDRTDENQQAVAAAYLARDTTPILERRLGRAIDGNDLYLAWFVGAENAARLLGAGDSARVTEIVPGSWLAAHGMGADTTVGDLRARLYREDLAVPVHYMPGPDGPTTADLFPGGSDFARAIPWQERLAQLRRIVQEERARHTEARVDLDRRMTAERTSLQAGLAVENPVSEAEFRAANGYDATADRTWNSHLAERALGADVGELLGANNAEIEEIRDRWRATGGEDVAEQIQREGVIDAQISEVRQERQASVQQTLDVRETLFTAPDLETRGLQPATEEEAAAIRLTEAEVIDAFGEEEGRRRIAQDGRLMGEALFRMRMNGMSDAAINAFVAGIAPEIGPDLAAEYESQARQAVAAERTIAARAADPAGYLAATNPTVRRAWERVEAAYSDGSDVMAATLAALHTQDAVQRELGLERRPWTTERATAFVQYFEAMDDPGQVLDQLVAFTSGLNDDELARLSLDQLVDAGLPGGVRYALDTLQADPVGRRRNSLAILTALSVDDVPRPTGAENTALNEAVNARVAVGMGGVRLETAALTGNGGHYEDWNAEVELVGRLAAFEYARNGGDADAAANTAYGHVFGHVDTLADEGLAFVSVPAGTDMDILAAGLRDVRRDLPTMLSGEDLRAISNVEGEAVYRDFADRLPIDWSVSAVWINQGDRFVLVEPNGGYVLENRDREPVSATLDWIMERGGMAAREEQRRRDRPPPGLGSQPLDLGGGR